MDPVAGPMQGEERSKYNIQKVKESRHREKISEIRKQAVSMRKDRQGGKQHETLRSESPQHDLDASMEASKREEEIGNESLKDGNIKDIDYVITEGKDEKTEGSKSKSAFYRKLNKVKSLMLQLSSFEKVDIAVKILSVHHFDQTRVGLSISAGDAKSCLDQNLSRLSMYQVRERAREIISILETYAEPENLLSSLLRETVYDKDITATLLHAAKVKVADSFLTREERVRRVAKEEAVTIISHRQWSDRENSVKHAITVVKKCSLVVSNHGDIMILANALGCHWDYAKKVLQAVGTDEEDTLFRRETKRDAVVASEWPSILQQYISRPDNSRYVPGNDSISLSYGRRVPRILLLRSKVKLLQGFYLSMLTVPLKYEFYSESFHATVCVQDPGTLDAMCASFTLTSVTRSTC